jgi:hypothetical protein
MLQKNIQTFILRKFDNMFPLLHKARFIISISCATVLLFASCSKSNEQVTDSVLQAYFNANILNTNYTIILASDSGVDITSQFAQDTILLQRDSSSYYNGIIFGHKDGNTYTGTWSSNSDYSELIINFTTPAPIPTEYTFLNRNWRFTKKGVPEMDLAPWGSTDPKVLHMLRL